MRVSPVRAHRTASVCPMCLKRIPARLVPEGDAWYMKKSCPEHGSFKTVVWRGAPELKCWGHYVPPKEDWDAAPDCPNACGLCSGHLQSTCCVLIEITSRCNLRCPVCFAESGGAAPGREKTPDELYEDFCRMTAENRRFIQLSGGEPTVRDDLPEIVAAAKRAGASSVQLNSNGLRLAEDKAFTRRLAEAGLDFVFMQFDGVSDAPEQAELLAKKLHGMQAHVNMIPLNNVEESGLKCSSHAAIERFQKILESHGVTATVRRTLGSDIDASCGQLRRKFERKGD